MYRMVGCHPREGYASKMMDAVLHDVAAAGYSKIMLWVFEANTRARRFYEVHGFAANGKAKRSLEATEVCYEKNLYEQELSGRM